MPPRITTRVLLVLLCSTTVCSAIGPQLLWSQTIPNGGIIGDGLRKGNGVVLSDNEQSLWVSAESGSANVFDSVSGNLVGSFHPEAIDDHYTQSRSSIALYQPNQSIDFAVYAVIDVPDGDGDGNTTSEGGVTSSRIIALHGGSGDEGIGTFKWSTQVEGVVEGTPLISSDGSRVYVISNTVLHASLTVLRSGDGSLVSQIVDPRPMAKYGPASMYTNQNNGVDKLYWADAHDRGYATGGRVHVLVSDFLSAIHSPRSFSSSSTVAPTLSSDGKKLWIGGRGATVHGWDEQSLHPIFSTALTQSQRNESYPIVNTIEMDDTESRLFVASASNTFHCIDSQSGNVLWSTNSSSGVFMTAAKYSSVYNAVYTIEHLSGTVTQHDADTGVTNWRISCKEITANPLCQDSVEADFSISKDGKNVYYGDVYGRIHAVKFLEPPTDSPSSLPSASPSFTPSQSPSETVTTAPSQSPSSAPSTSLSSVPSNEPTVTASDMPSVSLSPHSPSPTAPKETRSRGDPPSGNNPKPWKPDDLPTEMATSSAERRRDRWLAKMATLSTIILAALM